MSIIISKSYHEKIIKILRNKFAVLLKEMKGRPLKESTEGLKRGSWTCITDLWSITSKLDKDLAVEDFKNILTEIKKLK